MDQLSYIFNRTNDKSGPVFSLSPEHSDSFENQTILNCLVGTLVKFGASGKAEPYLAESWSKSKDGKHWTFKLRSDLICEDGTPINAANYVSQLQRRLLAYATETKVIAFNQLRGWDDFLERGDSAHLGLMTAGSNKIIFEFLQEPQELLEFLRMVYFGFWCGGNFSDGQFREDGHFISSGPYRLESNEGGRKIVLKKIPGWFSVTHESVKQIEFTSREVETEVGKYVKTIVRLGVSNPELRDVDSFHTVRSAPVILSAFILSPWTTSGFFNLEQNRKVFQSRLLRVRFPPHLESHGIYPSIDFYSYAPGNFQPSMKVAESYEAGSGQILVSLPMRLGKSLNDYVRLLILELLSDVSDRVHFENVDSSDPLAVRKMTSNNHFDIRVSSVDIGETMTNAFIDMMFCTSMGVSFPDPSGRMARLVAEYNHLGKEVDDAYVDEFNRILGEDAFVQPLFHSGLTILYSKDFDTRTIPAGTSHPRFEDFR